MFTVSKYIFRELLKGTVIAVVVIAAILLYGNFTRYEKVFIEALAQSPENLFYLAFLLFPYAMSMAIPCGYAVSLAFVIGRLSSDSEIKALYSLGFSFSKISSPVLIFSILLSCLGLFATLEWSPKNRAKFDELREKILWKNFSHHLQENGEFSINIGDAYNNGDQDAFMNFAGRKAKDISKITISVGEIQKKNWQNLRVIFFDLENQIHMVMNSSSASVQKSFEKGTIRLDLKNVDLELADENKDFYTSGSDHYISVKRWKQPLEFQVMKKEKPSVKRLALKELLTRIEDPEFHHQRIKAKATLNKSISLGCSPFFITLLVFPFTIKVVKKELMISVVAGISLCVLYYIIGTAAYNFTSAYSWHYFSWWIPNLLFILLGAGLWFRCNF